MIGALAYELCKVQNHTQANKQKTLFRVRCNTSNMKKYRISTTVLVIGFPLHVGHRIHDRLLFVDVCGCWAFCVSIDAHWFLVIDDFLDGFGGTDWARRLPDADDDDDVGGGVLM